MEKVRVIFICIHNSGRSQMAEAFLRHYANNQFEVHSAGIESGQLNPLVVTAMAEKGIDISQARAKPASEYISRREPFDYVITVCDETSAERCPHFPGNAKRLHWGFQDPASLSGNDQEKLAAIRPIRDAIEAQVLAWVASLHSADLNSQTIREAVRKNYKAVALNSASCGCSSTSSGSSSCCGSSEAPSKNQISAALGYSPEELASLPEGVNLGLGCGNPGKIADLKLGETVLDLGSGAGIDCFLAAGKVGPTGLVIGVDMTIEMLSKAREAKEAGKVANVDFRLGEIEHLPVADNSIDVIVSNCVINLSTDKPGVFAEAFRVLKAGGRLAVSDVVASKPLPEILRNDLALHAGCVAGALSIAELQKILEKTGFAPIEITPVESSKSFIRDWVPGTKLDTWVVSAHIKARKPQ